MPRRKKSKTKSGEGGVAGSANVQVVKAPEDGRRRQATIATSVTAFSLVAVVLGVFAPLEWREGVVGRWREVVSFANHGRGLKPDLSLNVSSCPGYSLTSVQDTSTGLTARLQLAGEPCNAYGTDVKDLSIEVSYESDKRLHVHIYDTSRSHFQVPPSVLPRPNPPSQSYTQSSSLVFNYNPSPFEFWVTRRDDEPGSAPIFDTRAKSMPGGGKRIEPVFGFDESTGVDGVGLVVEDQYLQLTTSLPLGTNIYGLGEVVASSGFRRDIGADAKGVYGGGSVQAMWARDVSDPADENVYGTHPFYLEHRIDSTTSKSSSHGVFLLSSAPSDILLLTPPNSTTSYLQYRLLRGTLDFYFFAGPTPIEVTKQYAEVVGLPVWVPYWSFGFHLCRWGYGDIEELREQVRRMREVGVPLETMWSDIDLYHAYRDFTTDPVRYPIEEVKEFIRELASNHQHYIPIVDAAIPKTINDTDVYVPYTRGAEQHVFITNPNGSEYVGQVWPGYTVFPDWFASNTSRWWGDSLRDWYESGVEFSGIWLDMNEVSSFCDGSCGSGGDISNTSTPFALPTLTENYPEGDPRDKRPPEPVIPEEKPAFKAYKEVYDRVKLEVKEGKRNGENRYNVDVPPYTIHNGFGYLSAHTLTPSSTHANGAQEIDVHNLWGLMEERATYDALLDVVPGKRPFLISRSTAPGSGRWSGHWLGDNHSLWKDMYYVIQGVLQFQLFQIPMVGPDSCGFDGNTNEELCNRWMQLSAFFPFYRNHNILGALPQEPYRWASVAEASRVAMDVRYRMLPYWYSLFVNASTDGTPPVRALFFEFPNEIELVGVDRQFMIGGDILVTPALESGVTEVDGFFPGRGGVVWRDWYTHAQVEIQDEGTTTLPAPLGHINVHIRSGAALLLHAEPRYTTYETREGPYELLVSLSSDESGSAFGWVYIDDGESWPPGPSKTIRITTTSSVKTTTGSGVDSTSNSKTNSKGGEKEQVVSLQPQGEFVIEQKLARVVVLGVVDRPKGVEVRSKGTDSDEGVAVGEDRWVYVTGLQKLVVEVEVDLNAPGSVVWWW